jgi:lipopolysaccharide biosynthesis glycosyltransferase
VVKETLEERRDVSSNSIIKYINASMDLLDSINNNKSFQSGSLVGKPTSNFNFIRFYFHVLLPRNVNKVIYIDTDMVVKGDITILNNLLTEEYDIGGVFIKEPYPLKKDNWIINSELKNNFKFQTLWNAGLFITYLDRWREKELGKKCMNLIIQNKTTKLFEGGTQVAMNIVFDKCLALPESYNVCGLGEIGRDDISSPPYRRWGPSYDNNVKKANVLHYTGSCKPWLLNENNYLNAYGEEWWSNLLDVDIDNLKTIVGSDGIQIIHKMKK